jgi:hypothetical protein
MGIIADFIKHGGNITNPRATHLCLIIVKIRATQKEFYYRKHILSSNQKGCTTTTSNVVRKGPKITQLEHSR